MVVIPLEQRTKLEDEHVEMTRLALERGSPITDYSAGPDSPTREVTPAKIATLADGLAVIRADRTRGVEIARNWSPAEPTPSPTASPAAN